jgi:hypothetical protein
VRYLIHQPGGLPGFVRPRWARLIEVGIIFDPKGLLERLFEHQIDVVADKLLFLGIKYPPATRRKAGQLRVGEDFEKCAIRGVSFGSCVV